MGGRNVQVLEGAAHGILAADGGQTQGRLHLEGAQECAQRFAPGMGIGAHALEVLLIGEAHAGIIGTAAGKLGAGFHHGISGAVVGAPEGQVRIVAEGHHAGGVRVYCA